MGPFTRIDANVGGGDLSAVVPITTIVKPASGISRYILSVRFFDLDVNANLRFHTAYGALPAIIEEGASIAGAADVQEHQFTIDLSAAAVNGVGGVNCTISVEDTTNASTGASWEWELKEDTGFAAASYTAPDNAGIASIKTKTDELTVAGAAGLNDVGELSNEGMNASSIIDTVNAFGDQVYNGVAFKEYWRHAGYKGKVTAVDNGDDTVTYHFRNVADNADLYTMTYNTETGVRSVP